MFLVGNFLNALAIILDKVAQLYSVVVMIAVLVQWVNPDPSNPIVQFLRSITEPVFAWVRRKLPFAVVGMIDLSPMVVFFGLWMIQLFVVRSLVDLAIRLR